MLTVTLRTLLLYFFLSFFLRVSGKRQLAEMEIGELVSVFLLSELAAIPLTDPNIPLLFALLPMALLTALELLLSCLSTLFPKFKRILCGTPSLLVYKGRLLESALQKNRLTLDELLSALRVKGISNLMDAEYVFLESTGEISVILKSEKQPPTCEDLQHPKKEKGIFHPLVLAGKLNRSNLELLGYTEKQLLEMLSPFSTKEVLLFAINDAGERQLIPKEKTPIYIRKKK